MYNIDCTVYTNRDYTNSFMLSYKSNDMLSYKSNELDSGISFFLLPHFPRQIKKQISYYNILLKEKLYNAFDIVASGLFDSLQYIDFERTYSGRQCLSKNAKIYPLRTMLSGGCGYTTSHHNKQKLFTMTYGFAYSLDIYKKNYLYRPSVNRYNYYKPLPINPMIIIGVFHNILASDLFNLDVSFSRMYNINHHYLHAQFEGATTLRSYEWWNNQEYILDADNIESSDYYNSLMLLFSSNPDNLRLPSDIIQLVN